jgi:hypothetical protein
VTETLTDEERELLHFSCEEGVKALRIIASQAAALDRVREMYDSLPQYPEREALLEFAERAIEALAAAPEHTVSMAGYTWVKKEVLDAANARVAELEAKHDRIWMSLKHPAARYAPMIGAPNNYMGMTTHPEGEWCRNEDVKLLVAVGEAAQSEVSVMRAEQSEFRAALQVAQREADGLRVELEREAKLRAHWHSAFEREEARCSELRAEVVSVADVQQWISDGTLQAELARRALKG